MKHIGVLTSGGDAAGMNAAIRSVVRTAIVRGLKVTGIRRGYTGLIEGDAQPMDLGSVGGIINRGGTILRTSRSARFPTPEGQAEAARQIERMGLDGLVVIGGDGSFRGAEALHATCGLAVVGIPGTIDNDIGGTEYTIGFDTAVNVALDAVDKVRDTADSHERLFVIEVMGRSNGHVAAAVGLAGGAEVILVPERPFDLVQVAERLKQGISRGKLSSIIVTAEGAAKAADVAVFMENYLKRDVRYTVLGHIQRGGAPTATERMMASRFGQMAVDLLIAGETCVMTAWMDDVLEAVPLSASWQSPKTLDLSLLELAELIAS